MLGAFRVMFDLLFETLPCRRNLPAQECVRLSRQISFAKIVILDLVRETISSNKQHLDRISSCCGGAPSLVLIDRHWVLLNLAFLRKG